MPATRSAAGQVLKMLALTHALGLLLVSETLWAQPGREMPELEKAFEIRFKSFCNEWGVAIEELTLSSSEDVCQCLYEFAAPRTTVQVKRDVVDLPVEAEVTDFDDVYGQSSMKPQIVEDITLASARCLSQSGEKRAADPAK